MAERDPSKPQLDFPQLVADIIEQLNLTGQIGLLDFLPTVQPVYLAAARSGVTLGSFDNPTFTSATIFSARTASPVAATTFVDTGQLAAGTYELMAMAEGALHTGGADSWVMLQHRNAANNANLAEILGMPAEQNVRQRQGVNLPLIRYEIALNERLRWQFGSAIAGTGGVFCMIALRVVPTP